jgi:hypothetical protein
MGLLKTAAKVAVASSVHGRIQRRQQQRWAAQDAAAAAPPPPPPVPPVPTPAQPALTPAQPAPPPEYGRPHFATEFTSADSPPAGHVPARPAPAARVDMATKLTQLQQLGELKSAGVLTDAEFEAQKSAILAQ